MEYRLMEPYPQKIFFSGLRTTIQVIQCMSFLGNNAVKIEKQVNLNLYKMFRFHIYNCTNLDEFISKFGKL